MLPADATRGNVRGAAPDILCGGMRHQAKGRAMDDRQGGQNDKGKLRASDADRQEVIERLRTALEEGRLKMDEYVQRMEQASEAMTYGDLAALYADLPEAGTVARRDVAALAPQRPRPVAAPGMFADLPTPLRVLWTIWAS